MGAIVPNRIDKNVACVPSAALALAEFAGADALLLFYAKDRVPTVETYVVGISLLVVLVPLAVVLSPFWLPFMLPELLAVAFGGHEPKSVSVAERRGIALCLVDARKGDAIWVDYEEFGWGVHFDTSTIDRLISDAYARFRKATQR